MERTLQLTWQPGEKNRKGRWRKRYQGGNFYFPGGRGKSDREAYQAALLEWQTIKKSLDAEVARRFEPDYLAEIEQWERMLGWARQHDDTEHADLAAARVKNLKVRLGKKVLPPLQSSETYDGWFTLAGRDPQLHAMMASLGEEIEQELRMLTHRSPGDVATSIVRGRTVVVPNPAIWDNPDPLKTEQAIWNDRLAVADQTHQASNLKDDFAAFLDGKKNRLGTGDLTPGRVDVLRAHIERFLAWFGPTRSARKIESTTLLSYRDYLLTTLLAESRQRRTVKNYLDSLKTFVQWLWMTERIDNLPRVMSAKSRELTVAVAAKPVAACSCDEIAKLLGAANDRQRLYLLLTLNTGMTQKDMSDLAPSEVDLTTGTIQRKRSKTKNQTNVPIVLYRLWPETLELVRKFATAPGTDRVLLNRLGHPLCSEELSSEGKLKKTDNVRNVFNRLRTAARVKCTFKSLKKKSASLINSSKDYHSVTDLFLGHSPRSIAERHYAEGAMDLLGEATDWLRQQYLDAKCPLGGPPPSE
jgi:integrase